MALTDADASQDDVLQYVQASIYFAQLSQFGEQLEKEARLGGGEWYLSYGNIIAVLSVVLIAFGSAAAAIIAGTVTGAILTGYITVIAALIMAIPGLQTLAAAILIYASIYAYKLVDAVKQGKGVATPYTLWVIPNVPGSYVR